MKDSFESFAKSNIDKWVINARGQYGSDALAYLEKNLGNKLIPFYLESKKGWMFDSRMMFQSIHSDYVFFWIEDHICTCGIERLNEVFGDVKLSGLDYIGYSWFGMGRFLSQFEYIPCIKYGALSYYIYDTKVNNIRQNNSIIDIGKKSYIISACGIFSRSFFLRMLSCNRPRLRRWPKETPFDFEKRWDDVFLLPIKYGVPNYELFSAIDDDNVYPGSSLFSRGMYPIRVKRAEMLAIRESASSIRRFKEIRKLLLSLRIVKFFWSFCKRLSYHF